MIERWKKYLLRQWLHLSICIWLLFIFVIISRLFDIIFYFVFLSQICLQLCRLCWFHKSEFTIFFYSNSFCYLLGKPSHWERFKTFIITYFRFLTPVLLIQVFLLLLFIYIYSELKKNKKQVFPIFFFKSPHIPMQNLLYRCVFKTSSVSIYGKIFQ